MGNLGKLGWRADRGKLRRTMMGREKGREPTTYSKGQNRMGNQIINKEKTGRKEIESHLQGLARPRGVQKGEKSPTAGTGESIR